MQTLISNGVDILNSTRVANLASRFGQRFYDKCFTPHEQAYCLARHNPNLAFAKRLAAKEAVAKALGCGIGHQLGWRDIEVHNHANGAPFVAASPALEAMLQGRHIALSLSDEPPVVIAFCVVSACTN